MRSWLPAAKLLGASVIFLSCHGAGPPGPAHPPGLEGATAPDAGRQKVEICHFTGNGAGHRIVISEAALEAHIENHGDHLVGAETCDGIDNDCDGETDEGGVCECPCDLSLPDPPLPFVNPRWECVHPLQGNTLHARLREKDPPTKALWQAIVVEDTSDPRLHTCSTLVVDHNGNIVSLVSIPSLDDGQARGCVDWILDNAATVGIACVPN
jgi:hypothetical protein